MSFQDAFTGGYSLTVEATEALFLDSNPQTITLGDEFDQEVLRFEAADDTTYRLVIQSTSGDSDMSLNIEIVQNGDSFGQNSFSVTNVARAAIDFTPEDGGVTEVKIRYFSFGDSIDFDISLTPAE
jgi:hypothetical protein